MRPIVERRLGERLDRARASRLRASTCASTRRPSGRAEIERAVELITTNETYFFRELPQLRAFEREVLPELHALGAASGAA